MTFQALVATAFLKDVFMYVRCTASTTKTLRLLNQLPSRVSSECIHVPSNPEARAECMHASELFRPSEPKLSVKLVPTFEDRACHVVGVTDPYGGSFGFLDRSRYFFLHGATEHSFTCDCLHVFTQFAECTANKMGLQKNVAPQLYSV
jgi:hypothetical protein